MSMELTSSRIRRAGGVAVVATVLVACGSARPSASSSPALERSVAATAAPTGSPAAEAPVSSAEGSSYGVDSTSWPGSLDGARTVLSALPAQARGEAREYMPSLSDREQGDGDPEGGDFAAVTYGEHLSVLVSDDAVSGEPGAPPQVVGARAKLAAMFGLVYTCDPDTYAGTIERSPDFPVPGQAEVDAATPAWFSCRIDGAEGAESFSAHAVGWTSDTTAWLAVGPDEQALAALVTALREANG